MVTPIPAVQDATLGRLQRELSIDVHDSMPAVLDLPYVAMVSETDEVVRVTKTSNAHSVRVEVQVVGDAFAENYNVRKLANEVAQAMTTALDLSDDGFTVLEQYPESISRFRELGEMGEHLYVATIVFLLIIT